MKKNSKIVIIGTGAMGTALGKVLFDSNHQNIQYYGVDENEIKELKKGINTKYFPNSTKLPEFNGTNDMEEALEGARYVILAIPSKVMDLVYAKTLSGLNSKTIIINASKGFYPGTTDSLHEGIVKISKGNENIESVVSLLGPSHAEEIVQSLLTIVAVVGKNEDACKEVQQLFNNDYFKTYIQTDVKGAEAGAAYKNILAIASGLAEGMGFGINAKAALITRGMAEMSRYNKAVKGKPKTISGLTGLGDLIVTATSNLSRNYRFGIQIANEGIDKALKTKETVEGFTALKFVYDFMIAKKLNLPIVDILYKLLNKKLTTEGAIKALWNRELKSE